MSYSRHDSPILVDFCVHLVEDVYGELAARVFSVLARHGRQTLAGIARASYLTGRQIKLGLVILIQQHLLFHSAHDPSVPATHYEIDWSNSYALVRSGKVVTLVQGRFGKKAANVMSNLLILGHTRITDLIEAYFPTAPDDDTVDGQGGKRKRSTSGTQSIGGDGVPSELTDANPVSDTPMSNDGAVGGPAEEDDSSQDGSEEDTYDIESVDELLDIVRRLIECGWLRTVTESQYLSPEDMHCMLWHEASERANGGGAMLGPKMRDKVLREVQILKRQMRDRWLVVPQLSRKRQTEDALYGGSNKRVKINDAHSHHTDDSGSQEDNPVIGVNPDKVAVAMRTEQLVRLVEQRIGPATALVYQVMLRTLEANIARCYEQWPDPPMSKGKSAPAIPPDPTRLVTARDVAKKLSCYPDIGYGLDPAVVIAITRRDYVHASDNLDQSMDQNEPSIDQTTELVDKHMHLLAEHPLHFATWHSRAGFSQWHVEFDEIAKQLIQNEIENTVSARKGTLGVKLLRALRKKGKLDERATCNAMMMSAADIRGIVNDLLVQGFVQTQEIPKVERREAKHSHHLIYYDRQRAREQLLHETYQGMIRILERISYEREQVKHLLAKAERSDVAGNEAKWLTKGELHALRKYKDVQDKLLLQLHRQDDLVATLRDFHGPLMSA